MVSKTKYYEYKAKGLCVKCGQDRKDSISEVRCAPCHSKYLESKKTNKDERLKEALCIQCGKEPLVGHSKLCNGCREKNAGYKKNLSPKPLSVYKESNEHCRLCDGQIDTLGIVCQKCLDKVQFTKLDAMMRYNEQCARCYSGDIEKLVFSSVDISVPMKHSGPDLYRYICFSIAAPKDYILVCSACYWKENYDYIKNLRDALLSSDDADDTVVDGVLNEDEENEDVIDSFTEENNGLD